MILTLTWVLLYYLIVRPSQALTFDDDTCTYMTHIMNYLYVKSNYQRANLRLSYACIEILLQCTRKGLSDELIGAQQLMFAQGTQAA